MMIGWSNAKIALGTDHEKVALQILQKNNQIHESFGEKTNSLLHSSLVKRSFSPDEKE
jgi:hypothetical protein